VRTITESYTQLIHQTGERFLSRMVHQSERIDCLTKGVNPSAALESVGIKSS